MHTAPSTCQAFSMYPTMGSQIRPRNEVHITDEGADTESVGALSEATQLGSSSTNSATGS